MARKLWFGIALAIGLGLVVAVQLTRMPPLASTAAVVAPVATASPTAAVAVAPSAPEATQAHRPVTGYDRYRVEMQRIRAARRDAQALQANERCIGGQRYRKVGTEWEQNGNC